MRNKLRKIYEKNEKNILWMYILLLFLFSVANKYQNIKKETNEALDNFEDSNITKSNRKKLYKKLVVYRYIYCIRANEYYLYNFSDVSFNMRDTFMTRQLTQRYYSVINKKRFRKVFDNKNLSYQVFNKYYKRDMICVRTEKGKYKFDKFIKDKDRFIICSLYGIGTRKTTQKELANTLSPKEIAERNKSYALFTLATIQKCYGEEIAKLSDKTVPLTELPGAAKVVDTLKDNPDPLVRASAIQALSYIQRPEYKKDLTTVFTVATNDADKGVADTVKAALEELNKI